MTWALPQSGPQEPTLLAALEWPGDVRDLPGAPGGSWWLLALLVVAAVGWRWRRRHGVATPAANAIAVPPVPTALAALRALAPPVDAASFGTFCAQLKALLRQHCRERFGFVAETRTSEELLGALAAPAAPTALRPCLQACDLVLFAAAATTPAQLAQNHAMAVAFAEATSAEVAA